ncbi:MAG: molybdopterin molybdotransferase MoeA, partial [Betaproteobacteria bacterium]
MQTIRELSCADDYDPNSMPVAKAREVIARFLDPVSAVERVHVRAGLGRVLAEDITSPLNVPAHDNSAMDGYAVRFSDLKPAGETTLKVAGNAFAGAPFAGAMQPGECVRIMTGGVIPAGADTIVMQEHVKAAGDQVTIAAGHRKGQNLRRAGEDLTAGQVALKRGSELRPADIGLIASLGIGEVMVYRKLRVAFFSTGDELVSVGTVPKEGQIY